MSVKSLFRNATLAMASCACAALIATAGVGHAQMQVLGSSGPTEDSAPQAAPARRLVLHGVRVKDGKLMLDPGSRAVLDYAVRMLRRSPHTVVYFGSHGDDDAMLPHAQAVAAYLERHGVAADRLMVPASMPPRDAAASRNPLRNHVIVLNLATAQPCGECS